MHVRYATVFSIFGILLIGQGKVKVQGNTVIECNRCRYRVRFVVAGHGPSPTALLTPVCHLFSM